MMIDDFKDLLKDFQYIVTVIPLVVSLFYMIIHIYNLYTKNMFESLFERKFTKDRDAIILYLCTSIFIISLIVLLFINNPAEDINMLTKIMTSILNNPIFYVLILIISPIISLVASLYMTDYGKNNRVTFLDRHKLSWKYLQKKSKIIVFLGFITFFILMIFFSGFPIGISISFLISSSVEKTTSDRHGLVFNILFFTTTFLVLFYPTYQVLKKKLVTNMNSTVYTENDKYTGEVLYISKSKMVVMLIETENKKTETVLIPLDRIVLAKRSDYK